MRTAAIILVLGLAACQATKPMVEYQSENVISLRYKAYDTGLTLTAEAIDMATTHCKKYGKYANYKGGNAVSIVQTDEVHNFSCDNQKVNDSDAIAKTTESRYNYGGTVILPIPVN